MQARRIIIPTEHLKAASGVKHLAVWVSDPDPTVYKHEDWVWLGTFVYLTEMWLDDSTSFFWSGCSALQVVVNAVEGKPLGTRNGLEPFGREDSKHPVRKLIGIGGTPSDERRITSLRQEGNHKRAMLYLERRSPTRERPVRVSDFHRRRDRFIVRTNGDFILELSPR